MTKIMSLDQLKTLRDNVKNKVDLRVKGENVENMVVVRVAMATCGIASGAREVMNYLAELIRDEDIENVVITQSGCMGYCYAEPTIAAKWQMVLYQLFINPLMSKERRWPKNV